MVHVVRPIVLAALLAALAAGAPAQSPPPFTPFPHTVGNSPYGVTASDFDLDGVVDLAVANVGSSHVSVLRGLGGGAFAPQTAVPAVPGGLSIAAGDLDADGDADLALVATLSPNVTLLLGDGAGGFAAPATVVTGSFDTPCLALGDLQGDGLLEIVVGEPLVFTGGRIVAFLWTGGATFTAGASVQLFVSFRDLVMADFDADGLRDVGYAATTSYLIPGPHTIFGPIGQVGWVRGDGAGGLSATGFGANLTPGPSLASMTVTVSADDVNHDGRVDLVATEAFNGTGLTLLPGLCWTFLSTPGGWAATQPPLAIGNITADAALGDLNADGNPDLAMAKTAFSGVSVAMGNGATGFGPTSQAFVGPLIRGITLADLDADGRPDLAAVGDTTLLTVLLNQLAAPLGASTYGVGSAGCLGVQGMFAGSAPQVGNGAFGFSCTNAPAGALGFCVVGNVASVPGTDVLGIGLRMHVDLAASSLLVGINAFADAGGVGHAPAPIPADPSLAGAQLFAQMVWLWPASAPCDPSPFGFSSSNGLAFTIQP